MFFKIVIVTIIIIIIIIITIIMIINIINIIIIIIIITIIAKVLNSSLLIRDTLLIDWLIFFFFNVFIYIYTKTILQGRAQVRIFSLRVIKCFSIQEKKFGICKRPCNILFIILSPKKYQDSHFRCKRRDL